MFLDDKLLQICKEATLENTEQIQELNIRVIRACEDYYKPQIKPNLINKDVKVILDKTFNLFDSFVRIALQSEDEKLKIIGKLFKQHTFKSQFMSNKEMANLYNRL